MTMKVRIKKVEAFLDLVSITISNGLEYYSRRAVPSFYSDMTGSKLSKFNGASLDE